MKQRFTARFADGQVVTRNSSTRTYSHCWRVIFTRDDARALFDRHVTKGFAASEELASAAARTTAGPHGRGRSGYYSTAIEVVAVAVG